MGCQPKFPLAKFPTTLVLGGARSGKSRYAEGLVQAMPGPWVYVATGQAFDDEMRARIALHRAGRSDGWRTVEAPLSLDGALAGAAPVLVDCLTLWVSNLLHAEADVGAEGERLVEILKDRRGPTVLVSNEVGMGIVPENALARAFRDAAGRLHQRLASVADRVVLVVAGLPLIVKDLG